VAHTVLSGSSAPNQKFATIVAMDLPDQLTVTAADLGFNASSSMLVWDGRVGVSSATVTSSLTLAACGKSDFHLMHVGEVPPQGQPTLLGEGGMKIVPHSPFRFSASASSSSSVRPSTTVSDQKTDAAEIGNPHVAASEVTVEGIPGETVDVSFWLDGKVLTASCAFVSGRTVAQAGVDTGAAYCRLTAR
jgi:hypothetical protein